MRWFLFLDSKVSLFLGSASTVLWVPFRRFRSLACVQARFQLEDCSFFLTISFDSCLLVFFLLYDSIISLGHCFTAGCPSYGLPLPIFLNEGSLILHIFEGTKPADDVLMANSSNITTCSSVIYLFQQHANMNCQKCVCLHIHIDAYMQIHIHVCVHKHLYFMHSHSHAPVHTCTPHIYNCLYNTLSLSSKSTYKAFANLVYNSIRHFPRVTCSMTELETL